MQYTAGGWLGAISASSAFLAIIQDDQKSIHMHRVEDGEEVSRITTQQLGLEKEDLVYNVWYGVGSLLHVRVWRPGSCRIITYTVSTPPL